MDRGSTPRTSTITAARHHLQHSADPCGVFAYVPASALPLAKSRFAPPLEDCAFRLASALAPSRELCSRGGSAAKSGAHLASFLRVSHFGRVQGIICSTPQIPAECLRMCLRLLFRSRMPNITHPPAFEHMFAMTLRGWISRGSLPLKLRKNPKDTDFAVSFGFWWSKSTENRTYLIAQTQ